MLAEVNIYEIYLSDFDLARPTTTLEYSARKIGIGKVLKPFYRPFMSFGSPNALPQLCNNRIGVFRNSQRLEMLGLSRPSKEAQPFENIVYYNKKLLRIDAR